jgi:hypothetical protein
MVCHLYLLAVPMVLYIKLELIFLMDGKLEVLFQKAGKIEVILHKAGNLDIIRR